MNARDMFVVAAGVGLLSAAVPVGAHHSFDSEFDRNKPVTITGTVTKFEWTNPHGRFYVDVKDPTTGNVVNWDFELGSAGRLMRLGWTRNSLKIGEEVTVSGFAAKNGPHTANTRSVTLADGKRLFSQAPAGSPTQ